MRTSTIVSYGSVCSKGHSSRLGEGLRFGAGFVPISGLGFGPLGGPSFGLIGGPSFGLIGGPDSGIHGGLGFRATGGPGFGLLGDPDSGPTGGPGFGPTRGPVPDLGRGLGLCLGSVAGGWNKAYVTETFSNQSY